MNQLFNSGTFLFVDKVLKGQYKIDSKQVLKVKSDTSGEVNKYKARLITKGFIQTRGIDFIDIYDIINNADLLKDLIRAYKLKEIDSLLD